MKEIKKLVVHVLEYWVMGNFGTRCIYYIMGGDFLFILKKFVSFTYVLLFMCLEDFRL
jgi:hypothetical protein